MHALTILCPVQRRSIGTDVSTPNKQPSVSTTTIGGENTRSCLR